MSQENVEIVRRLIEAWNRRDLDGAIRDLHPDAELDWSESSGVQRGVYRGVAEIRRFWEEWLDVFEENDVRPEAFIDAGEYVVVPNRTYMRGRDGVEVDAGSTSVWTLRDGKIVWHRLYGEKEAALEAVGLSEQAMSEENVEIVRSMYRAHLRGETEAALGLFDPDVECDASVRPDGRVWHGPEGVRQAMLEWMGTWDDYSLEIHRIFDAGDSVIALWTERGRGKESGITLELHGGTVHSVRDGKITHMAAYDRAEKALKAIGLSD